jgi:dolichol-phosphate mannosyltransferase
MKTLVVLPSYNERDNIVQLVDAILDQKVVDWICVVDDSSPDGTSELVAREIETRSGWRNRVSLLQRAKKDGRGGAVRDGFAWGRNSGHGFDCFVEMDCDFSHEPTALATGVALREGGADLVIGARYPDGKIVGWSLTRRVFSRCANLLARALIDWSIPDYTNGYRFYSPRAVDVLLRQPQRHRGYIYLSESLSYLLREGMRVARFPTYFKYRERGASNTSLKEVRSALLGIVAIGWKYRFSRTHDPL